jgi:hypothetical protein
LRYATFLLRSYGVEQPLSETSLISVKGEENLFFCSELVSGSTTICFMSGFERGVNLLALDFYFSCDYLVEPGGELESLEIPEILSEDSFFRKISFTGFFSLFFPPKTITDDFFLLGTDLSLTFSFF